MATVGKNILDNLTTGMYSDSKVTYREYIQNACDQIDIAISEGLLDTNEGLVDIFIDEKARYVSIRDNATGVKKEIFVDDLGDIANSNKQIGKNKGFRGIGRLCGLAYCKKLQFKTSYYGENVRSLMICDAKRMREMLVENKKYTLDEIWNEIVTFKTEPEAEEVHYFEVEMFDINNENTDLLDVRLVNEYLSFVAPVPYKNTFLLRNQIYKHAELIGYNIDEYCIKVNGHQVFKDYTTNLKEPNGSTLKVYDEITKLEFEDFYNANKELIAWLWVGLSRFEKQIPKTNQMRGLRLRSENIQLGKDDTLQQYFKETRGNYYFVGEVFAVDKNLIPNSQRDYFNENETRVVFEKEIKTYFYDVLHKIYNDANKIKNAYKRQEDYVLKVEEYEKKSKENGFVDEDDRKKLEYSIELAKKEAADARKQLEKYDELDAKSPIAEVSKSIGDKFNSEDLRRKATEVEVKPETIDDNKKPYVTSSMSKLSRSERKIVGRILTIITDVAPKDIADQIIERIKDELR